MTVLFGCNSLNWYIVILFTLGVLLLSPNNAKHLSIMLHRRKSHQGLLQIKELIVSLPRQSNTLVDCLSDQREIFGSFANPERETGQHGLSH
jgi:hypothetical protein